MAFSFVYTIPGVRLLHTKLNLLTSYVPPPPPENHDVRKILMVHAHPVPDSFSASIADAFAGSAEDAGHEVKRISLYEHDEPRKCYRPNLSRKERESYFSHLGNQLSPEVKSHVDLLRWCDTLVFIYPTWWMNTPASLKGFFDRTLVPGLTWEFPSDKKKGASLGLVPKLGNIERIIGISTYGASQFVVTLAGDNGRRMISNAVRHSVAPNASMLWLGLYGVDVLPPERCIEFLEQVRQLPKNL
jgi:NAD(P)H dehydrogenase (quinone)